jgi:cobalt-precorrin 5A hydrolase
MTPNLLMVTAKAKMMLSRRVAVFAITRQGVETAIKIQDVLNKHNISSQVRVPKKYAHNGVNTMEKKLGDALKDVFDQVDGVVAVMSTGIVVRKVTPLLRSKITDPAVVCVDVSGKFAISLVSGHYGGANELTKIIAEGIGAVPVITTASDVMGKQSVDELARIFHYEILNPKSLVAVNAALVDGKKLVLVFAGIANIPQNVIKDYEVKTAKSVKQAIEIVNGFEAGAIVTDEKPSLEGLRRPVTFLKPKKIVVGIGSRKVVNEDDIVETVKNALKQVKVPLERVDRLATVDIKKDSLSMNRAANKLGHELEFISTDEIGAFRHEDLSPDSKIVKEKIGVGGVCEQAALITAGKKAKLILKKTKAKGVTIAIAVGE